MLLEFWLSYSSLSSASPSMLLWASWSSSFMSSALIQSLSSSSWFSFKLKRRYCLIISCYSLVNNPSQRCIGYMAFVFWGAHLFVHNEEIMGQYRLCNIMWLLLRCNGFNNLFAVSFHSICSSFFLPSFYFVFVSFLLVGLEYCTLKSLEHFSFNSVRWGGSWYFRPSSRGGLANFTPIAGMGYLISDPKFKISTLPPPPANFWQVPKILVVGSNVRFWRCTQRKSLQAEGTLELGESGGMVPQKIFKFEVSEMPSPAFSEGLFH